MGRKGPWGDIQLSNQGNTGNSTVHANINWCVISEIIARVISPQNYGIFRPPLRILDVPEYVIQCLHACWEEDPDDRPDIRLVRVKLKPMQAGL